jgi:hypothetical protein
MFVPLLPLSESVLSLLSHTPSKVRERQENKKFNMLGYLKWYLFYKAWREFCFIRWKYRWEKKVHND